MHSKTLFRINITTGVGLMVSVLLGVAYDNLALVIGGYACAIPYLITTRILLRRMGAI